MDEASDQRGVYNREPEFEDDLDDFIIRDDGSFG
jgi:hypothetical protein